MNHPDCICFWTPEHTWFRYGSAVEPGSQMEPNPDCPVHFPKDMPPTECDCGGFIAWQRVEGGWDGSCYGKCSGYPTVRLT